MTKLPILHHLVALLLTMRSNGNVCIFCRRLSSNPAYANRRTFNSQASDSTTSPQPNGGGAGNSQLPNTRIRRLRVHGTRARLGHEPRPRYQGRRIREWLEDKQEKPNDRLRDEKHTLERKRKLGATPLDLIRLALDPHEVDARSRAATEITPEINNVLNLFGSHNDVFSQVLIGLIRERELEHVLGEGALRRNVGSGIVPSKQGTPTSQRNDTTRSLTQDTINRRLQLAHTIDDILELARIASQTAYGRLAFMNLTFPLHAALKRCGFTHEETLAAFNCISSMFLKCGSGLDFKYCMLGLKIASRAGSPYAMRAIKQYLNACREPTRQPTETWMKVIKRISKSAGTIQCPRSPAAASGRSTDAWKNFQAWECSGARKRREALNVLTGWETAGIGSRNETRDISFETFLDRQSTPMFAEYILSLGRLGASEAIWQEWVISRDYVLADSTGTNAQANGPARAKVDAIDRSKRVGPCAAPNVISSPEELLYHFFRALTAAKDIWRSWQLIGEVRKYNPALLSPRIWASLLGYCHPYYYPRGHIFTIHRSSILSEIIQNSIRAGGGTTSIRRLAEAASLYWGRWNAQLGGHGTRGWREKWTVWANRTAEVVQRDEVDYVADVERALGVEWVTTEAGGGGTHIRKTGYGGGGDMRGTPDG
ncbi:MAG: hypothetical protein M1840_005368 [Geoglossum simile]|nr:MAG: hypothetical protein M1840_005368 [Geoglossum simile]